jgi:predicted peroxiredoxin
MFNSEAEIVFPLRILPSLRQIRGESWTKLVDQITHHGSVIDDKLAMELIMVRLAGCINCDSDSFRAMKGCEFCIRQALRRFKGTDSDLVKQFEQAKKEIKTYIKDKELALTS